MSTTGLTNDPINQTDRIAARRNRVELLAKVTDEHDSSSQESRQQEDSSSATSQSQVQSSLASLKEKKMTTNKGLSSIRDQSTVSEEERRTQADDRTTSRLQMVKGEAHKSEVDQSTINEKWAELLKSSNVPLKLNDQIKEQKTLCEDILVSKTRIINNLQAELKLKDDEYVKGLKQQSADVELLLQRMRSQYIDLELSYREEIEAIEQAFLTERSQIVENNKVEIDGLYEKRRVMEVNFLESMQRREEKFQEDLAQLRIKDAEDYNQLKVKLESDIQSLQQQLEEMRATYQLNTEKLEYNYKVLTDRDGDNSALLGQHKKKLGKLKDILSSLITKYQTLDKTYRQENLDLTEEYKRITKKYKELQNKFRHFEVTDNKKYHQMWDMHEREISEMVNRLLAADQIIQEQQLGLQWIPPEPQALEFRSGYSNNNELLTNGSPRAGEKGSDFIQSKVSNLKVKYMLEMLIEEAGFLIDEKTKHEVQTMDTDGDDPSLLRADAILKALNVHDEHDVKVLLGFFFEDPEMHEESEFAFRQAGNTKPLSELLGLKIQPEDVVNVLTQYVNERKKTESSSPDNGNNRLAVMVETDNNKTPGTKSEQEMQEECEYWARLADLVPDRTSRVWTALEAGLKKYHQALVSRSKGIEEMKSLAQENEQLRAALMQHERSQMMQDLVLPPTNAFYNMPKK